MDGLSWLIVVGCIAAAMFFSACNYALRTFSRVRLEEELARLGRGRWLEPLVGRLGQAILTTATLRILFNIAAILALAEALRAWAAGRTALHLIGVVAVAFVLIILFSVAIPNAWAKYAGEGLLARTAWLLAGLRSAFSPLTALLHGIDEVVRRLAGAPPVRDDAEHIEKQILSVVSEGEREGVVAPEEKDMIESVLEFQDTRADQIMTPRTEIVALDGSADLPTALATVQRAGHSRIPIFEGNLDNIVGVLYVKDLLGEMARGGGAGGEAIDLRKLMRQPLFVPESKMLRDLLADLRRRKVHIAIVLDEFGGTAGLVTFEDVLEQIVGDVADEHEQPQPAQVRRVDERTWELDGRVHVDDLNDQLDLDLPEEEDYDTIGGMVISRLGRIPRNGEKVTHGAVTLTVLDAEPRKINRLKLELARPEAGAASGGR